MTLAYIFHTLCIMEIANMCSRFSDFSNIARLNRHLICIMSCTLHIRFAHYLSLSLIKLHLNSNIIPKTKCMLLRYWLFNVIFFFYSQPCLNKFKQRTLYIFMRRFLFLWLGIFQYIFAILYLRHAQYNGFWAFFTQWFNKTCEICKDGEMRRDTHTHTEHDLMNSHFSNSFHRFKILWCWAQVFCCKHQKLLMLNIVMVLFVFGVYGIRMCLRLPVHVCCICDKSIIPGARCRCSNESCNTAFSIVRRCLFNEFIRPLISSM